MGIPQMPVRPDDAHGFMTVHDLDLLRVLHDLRGEIFALVLSQLINHDPQVTIEFAGFLEHEKVSHVWHQHCIKITVLAVNLDFGLIWFGCVDRPDWNARRRQRRLEVESAVSGQQ